MALFGYISLYLKGDIEVALLFNSSMCIEQETSNDFVDRRDELSLCLESIIMGDKAIVIGERGVGKSALVKRVEYQLRNNYDQILPIYIRFSPINFGHNSHTEYVYHLLISLIQYIWKNILGNKLTALYDDNMAFTTNELTAQVQKVHKLARMTTQNVTILHQKELEAELFVKGNMQKSQEYVDSLNPLSNQEMIGLFSELCDDLINHSEVESLAFLCDEANLLDESQQLEIERDLSNIFPMLSCSFLYVASISTINGHHNPHTECFEQVICVEGFKSVEHSKKLLQNRILQKDRIEIDDQVYDILHETAHGNPRHLINIMEHIIMRKSLDGTTQINITPQDAQVACDSFIIQQKQERRMLADFLHP